MYKNITATNRLLYRRICTNFAEIRIYLNRKLQLIAELGNKALRANTWSLVLDASNRSGLNLKRLLQNKNKIMDRDSRNHLRKSCNHPLLLVYKYHHIRGVAINISRGGTFIETGSRISWGEKIDMVFQGGKGHKDLKLRGWIVRLEPEGVGVSFDRRSRRERRYDLDRRTGLDRRVVDKR